MPSLSRELRRLLERTIAGKDGARQIAECGAEQSLTRLAVDRHEPHTSLTPAERTLRNQLRAHGRQLGDKRDLQRGTQTISHLKQAVAYEHWHRLLFARFLAENDLLMHPEHGVALTLDEVKEVALGKGCDWIDLAADFAQQMLLREVFRADDPALRVSLAPEKRRDLEAILNSLPREVFLADDSLGWVYQFWQKDSKEVINKSSEKVGADQLSPVTQLFTDDYMVLFLLENTLGAWWTARTGASNLPGYTWSYLRLNDDGSPAAGCFVDWPKRVAELRVLDPSMGSGHFLTFALPILVRMRAAEESLGLADAVIAVLRDNIFGLELDPRCSQIAAFNLALTAWKLAGKYFDLPPMNIACSGLGINAREVDWVSLADSDSAAAEGMQRLYSLFRDAPILGSLIDPQRFEGNLYSAGVDRLIPLLEEALKKESASDDVRELAVAARGMLTAFRILSSRFTLVATNVPYLLKAKQCEELQKYCKKYAPDAISDLATVFLERCTAFCQDGGTHATVTPQNWLFLKSYSEFRKRLLKSCHVSHVTTVGSGATATASWDVLRALVIVSKSRVDDDYVITGVETDAARDDERANDIKNKPLLSSHVQAIISQPNCRLSLSAGLSGALLGRFATSLQGLATGDKPRFQGCFWEFWDFDQTWAFQQGPVSATHLYAGREKVIRWEKGAGDLAQSDGARVQGLQALGRRGIAITQMRSLPASVFSGSFFDNNVAVILPKDDGDFIAMWCYCSSESFAENVRRIDKKLSVTNATFGHVPFDRSKWFRIASELYPSGLPSPSIVDITQWLFGGNPKDASHPLQVAVCRLAGYRWPRERGCSFPGYLALVNSDLEPSTEESGILCLNSLSGAPAAAEQLRTLLAKAYGPQWSSSLLSTLLGESRSLEDWLRDDFFEEHCAIFGQRPFIWHVWDGQKDGFHAFINCLRLNRHNLEKLIYMYLGDWIERQRQDVRNGLEGADTRLAAAEHLQNELKKILEGEKPYDIFVRWKPMDKQAICWEPDLNDGVRMNIRPWITEAKLYKSTKPGILRVTPNIKYTKDRGKEPVRDPKEFPWFAKSTDRINDAHLSLDEKRRARGLQ